MQKVEGLIAATFCGYNVDGSVNLTIIPRLVENLIRDGVKGIYVCGTNGEGPNLTIAERKQVAEAYINAVQKRVLVFVHVGHSSIAEAQELAKHAVSIGADAISSVAAFYFKPTGVENLVSCMAAIASAAPSLPFYYYHIPVLTGISIDMIEFLERAETTIPNLAGIKYTASTIHEYQACLNYKNGKYDILFGYDELLLPALAVGAKGAIGSTYTFAAPIYQKVMQYFEAGELEKAQFWQLQAVEMIRCFTKYPSIPAQRAIMLLLGEELGDCRLPLTPLTTTQISQLHSALASIGFFKRLEELHPTLPVG
ncbi:dihydrodipicolinate synthase family protein [Flavihumibacter sp. UBA7668]|uniref:dihydrodipicolinate synthase family protein n=1 Tax=Flavihumibacter sp. UBA7668 TaxID=1946542 RepID=UPI0025BC6041|nr:dihydrodipicolinate synthase family protein [Flavihumibacter sp. UBA7668]